MKRLKGPELKLSDLKVPAPLLDLYYDLKDRRLLPLVALLLVAIVATPFLLGGSDKPAEPAPAPVTTAPGAEASLAVLPAEPGLREPSKRLAGRPAKNPFRQHYTAPVFNKGAAPTAETSTVTETTTQTETTTSPETGSVGGGPPSSGAGSVPAPESSAGGNGGHGSSSLQPGEVQLYSFAINVKIAHTETTSSGATKMGEPAVREAVDRGTALPGAKAPVLTYLGVDDKFENALMLVSPQATGLLGDNKCLSGTTSCQLLALEPDLPEVVEYGENGARYKFELLSVEPVKGPKIKEPTKGDEGSKAKSEPGPAPEQR